VPLTLAPTITDNFETVVGTATASPFTSSQALAGLESGPNVGIIVGVSVGGVVLAICVVVGALLCCRKRPSWYSLKETEVSQFNSNIATTLMDPKIADLI
jgi:Ca2+/Na+ antiporter